MNITITIKSNYGNEAIYPICNAGKNILKLTGRKTLTRSDINILKNMGYSITVKGSTL